MPEAYYVVFNGRRPGVYATWEACRHEVDGFSDARYRRFASPEAAARAWDESATHEIVEARPRAFTPDAIAVDGACAHNPGPCEYRGVDLATGTELFRQGPMHGTNNLAEFLAIVHALAIQHARGSIAPVWSDSRTAIEWTRARRIGSTLPRNPGSARVWELADRALAWLFAHPDHAPLIKWPTSSWGEIPADFGRKGSRRADW